ncbi:hypothetical protein BS47DRAFT_743106 [Hydnum rufescens UP504]|uniref:Uncharacterized protein n=1 Tax=Hydnum rufescens UP504 TaxID=1448309 RepID=A0A9P6DUU6_9AGAM|nr:hypothetical protein BS47DRAFT_743106 [Hydnum rufescens UP504]
MRTSCATSYGDYGTIVWLHEAARPEEFRYKTDAQQRSLIVMQQMWEHADPQATLLENIKDVLRNAEHGIRHSSTYALRGILPRLRDPTITSPLCSRLIALLAGQDSEIELDFAALSEASRVPLDRSRLHFRQTLATHLFRSKALVRSRLKLLIAQICSRTTESVDPNAARSFNELGATYELSIVQDTLCVVLACLSAFSEHISGSEANRVFAARLTSLALLLSNPRPQLIELARTLGTKLSLPLLEFQKTEDPLIPTGALVGCANMGEICPACEAGIKIAHLTSAICENGHIWGTLLCISLSVNWGAHSSWLQRDAQRLL